MDDPGVGPIWKLTSPACRVICPAGTDEIKSVAVWSPGHGYRAVRPDPAQLDVVRGLARQVAGEAGVGGAGVGGGNLPAEGAEVLSLVQELADPRLLICRVVGVMAQIAAAHVGFPPVVAEAIGRLAAGLASRVTEPEPESPGMRVLQYADVTFSVAGDLSLDVGRVEVRWSENTDRGLRALDRDPPARRGSVVDPGRPRVSPVPGQRPDRAARAGAPGVGWAVRSEPARVRRPAALPGVGRKVRTEPAGVRRAATLRGVSRPRWYRRVAPYRPGPGDLPGRGSQGEPPSRGGPPAR